MRRDPLCKLRIARAGQREDRIAQHAAVMLDVVAAQRREGFFPVCHAAAISLDHDVDGAAWPRRFGNVLLTQCVFEVKLLGGVVEALSVLGNGETDDPHARSVDGVEHRRRILAGEDDLGQQSDHSRRFRR